MTTEGRDTAHMHHALRLAARGLGSVAPNPAVGCVIVSKDNRIVGRGWTAKGGRPHAETIALAQAGEAARGSTAYVSLEPCSHHGKTPPCADALIAAGVARVVGAIKDPDPRTSGKGFAKLKAAGIEVVEGVLADEAKSLNEGFFKRIEQGRPLIALKVAESTDGCVARGPTEGRWITGERARAHGQLLRTQYDAILIGIGTALADDPELTCRLPGLEDRSPIRIVLDSKLRLPPTSKLAQTARKVPVIIYAATEKGAPPLRDLGVEVVVVGADDDGHPDLNDAVHAMAARGLTRVLVEGGPLVHAAFLRHGLTDRVYRYRSPLVVGPRGLAGAALPPAQMRCTERLALPPDVLESFVITG